jgi:hypothetical protein
MKLIAILVLGVILNYYVALTDFGFPTDANRDDGMPYSSLSDTVKQSGSDSNANPDENSSSFSSNNNELNGLLLVKVTVNNEGIGNKKPSDFTISIHANDPSIASFPGNSSGTELKVGMGMYSVSESPIPGYISSFSADCFGGIMSVETKKCVITNTRDKSLLPSR